MEQCDYVDMPHNLAKAHDRVKEINIENILNTKREDMAVDWEEVATFTYKINKR